MITGAQIREARELLGWRPSHLAKKVGAQVFSINRAEAGQRTLIDFDKIERCLKTAGIKFGDDGRVMLRDFGERREAG